MVRLTRIYTRTGDAGHDAPRRHEPGRQDRPAAGRLRRRRRDQLRDRVALALGAARATVAELLRRIQNDLFDVGADLCTPVTPDPEYPPLRVTPAYIERLEAACDEYNEGLPKLSSFILPGGTPAAALLHVARTVVRRAERSVWALLAADAERTNAETARYLNRLSDLLFILARIANPGGDVLWQPGAHSGAHAQRAPGCGGVSPAGPTPPRTGSRSPSSCPSPAPACPPGSRSSGRRRRTAARGRRGRGCAGTPPGPPTG